MNEATGRARLLGQAPRRVILAGGRVVDPDRGIDQVADLVLEAGRVVSLGLGQAPAAGGPDTLVVDARDLWVLPGFVDLHVHLRTPGQEYKEDIATGTAAAAAGGYTAVCCMPNTRPPLDSAALISYVKERAAREGSAAVHPIGCITRGQEGQGLAEIGEMAEAGAVALSDDGRPVMNPEIMRAALTYARQFNMPVSVHEEDLLLAAGGVMHEGATSARLGLKGQPGEAESAMVARDVLLAEATGAHLHIAHISTAAAVEAVRQAKARGVRVTAEATPHHLLLTDEAVAGGRHGLAYDTNTKCNPPLRSEADRQAVLEGLVDGTIDAIATDHAPHSRDEKDVEYDRAAFGISGLETALGLVLTHLVTPGRLTLAQAVDRLSSAPARLFGLPGGTLAPGRPADLALVDPGYAWTVDPASFRSKGKNSPFGGWRLTGRVVMTILGGRIVHALD